jgi:hypothetical protein
MNQIDILIILLGALIGGLLVLINRRWMPEQQGQVWANSLIIAALIYVGFALFGGRMDALGLEILGVILFTIPALLGMRYSAYFTAVGWLLHPIWDVALHSVETTPFVYWWYPLICLGFDVLVGVYLLWWGYSKLRSTTVQQV